MKRRIFLAALTLAALAAGPARAEVVAGRDYAPLPTPLATESPDKIEVLEFFWYGCPHCYSLHPHLSKWVKAKPADVNVRYVPAIFRDSWVPGAKLFYALEATGDLQRLNDAVYDAIHLETIDLNDERVLFDWIAKKGVDRKKFEDAYKSFAVQTKVTKAKQLTKDSGIRGVPAVIVEGKYHTSGSFTGTEQAMIQVIDELVKKARAERASKR